MFNHKFLMMKNLNQMGVHEMNTQEMQKVDGGLPWYAVMALGWVGHLIYESINDWEENVNEFHKGYADTKAKLDLIK